MIKNPTPRLIALYTSTFISLIVTATATVITFLLPLSNAILLLSGLLLLTFIISYFIIAYYLKKYIYRKIKVIYKSIHKQKISAEGGLAGVNLSENIIEKVEKEVEEWSENQQKEIEKFKSWADYRRKYIGDISHELKTPVFNIQGYLHTLLEGGLYDKNINLSYLKKAVKNVDRLQTIIEDLSAISRLESGEMVLDLEEFDIKTLAEEVFEELEYTASKKEIKLFFKEGTAGNYTVSADRETIRQVLLNLIGNSIKYSEESGTTTLSFYDMHKQVLIEISDNGIGVDEKHIPFVFDRFYRVDKSRSRKQGGTGLGLSIVKHIIEAHGQRINLRSTKGIGSTFGFTLEKAK